MKVRFLRHAASNGCTALSNRLRDKGVDSKKLLIRGSTYRGFPTHLIINWGSSDRKLIKETLPILNEPEAVRLASDKVLTYQTLRDEGMSTYLPRWTIDVSVAQVRLTEEREVIYVRKLTRASEGRGITVVCDPETVLPQAGLYTCQVDVERELRVHVFGGEVIDFSQKKRMGSERRESEGIEEADEDIRSHSRGWVFARQGVEINNEIEEVAVHAVSALGLDFGAVDLATTPQGGVKIYEINTAPGLEGTTLERYVESVHALLQL